MKRCAMAGLLLSVVLSASAGEFSPKITDLTIFKDGHCLVMARGEVLYERNI